MVEWAWGNFVVWTAAEQSKWFFEQIYIYHDFRYNLSTLGLIDSSTGQATETPMALMKEKVLQQFFEINTSYRTFSMNP